MNPTVSVIKTFFPEMDAARVVVEKVVNKRGSTGIDAFDKVLNNVLLPALV